MKASILFVLLCVFIAGVFLGIWMDWSVPRHQDISYALEDYQMANLQVRPGDKITLLSSGNFTANPLFDFVGNSPCVGDQTPVNPCVIKSNLGTGSYFYTCKTDSSNDFCPDPGVQPSPTGPGPFSGYWRTVARDFRLAGAAGPPAETGKPDGAKAGPAVPTPLRTFVYCNSGTTVLLGQDHKPLTTITAAVGQSVFWISSNPFSLTTTSYPDGLCSGGNPTESGQPTVQCAVNMSKQSMQYTVQAQSCNQSSPLTLTSQ